MIELGLQRISRLLSKTALPWRAIHVAGTNGKGSICAAITKSLQVYNESRYRSSNKLPAFKLAQYTSPHLIDRWDCITIDQNPVPYQLFHQVEEKVLVRNVEENIQASEFEILTATAFEIFSQQNVDIGVIEVGMGGRLDATNIIGQPVEEGPLQISGMQAFRPSPLVTAIAKIGMDHQAFLGNTLRQIATEKAGIMKPNVPVVMDTSNVPEVLAVLTAKAGDRIIDYPASVEASIPCDLPQHVRENLRVAQIATFSALSQLGCLPPFPNIDWTSIHMQDIQKAMLAACLEQQVAGRQQYIDIASLTKRRAPVLCDGAHNAQSAEVLAISVQKIRDHVNKPIIWVLATSNSKDCRETLRPLLRRGDAVHAVAFGPVDGMPWVKATEPEDIMTAVRELEPDLSECVNHGSNLTEAIRSASDAAAEGPLVIAGSLYLIGDVYRILRSS